MSAKNKNNAYLLLFFWPHPLIAFVLLQELVSSAQEVYMEHRFLNTIVNYTFFAYP